MSYDKKQPVTLNLSPKQLVLVTTFLGHLHTQRGAAPSLNLQEVYKEFVGVLGAKPYDFSENPFGTVLELNKDSEEILTRALTRTKFKLKFEFAGKNLPKSVVFFEYPDSENGTLKPRLLKVEDEDLSYIKGYEVDIKTLQPTWNFKTFLKSKVQSLIRNA